MPSNTQSIRKRKPNRSSTRKIRRVLPEPLIKGIARRHRSLARNKQTFLMTCNPGDLIGLHTIDQKPPNARRIDDALQVIKGELRDYPDPVVIKIYCGSEPSLKQELAFYCDIANTDFKAFVPAICIMMCDDDVRYYSKYYSDVIQDRKLRVCKMAPIIRTSEKTDDNNRIYSTYEYKHYDRITAIVTPFMKCGDYSTFMSVCNIPNDPRIQVPILYSVIMQMVLSTAELALRYGKLHGDINSGNFLVRPLGSGNQSNTKQMTYLIDNVQYSVPLAGYEVLLTDFARTTSCSRECKEAFFSTLFITFQSMLQYYISGYALTSLENFTSNYDAVSSEMTFYDTVMEIERCVLEGLSTLLHREQ